MKTAAGNTTKTTSINTVTTMTSRSTLLVATAGLAIVQLIHLLDVLRYADGATFPGVLFDPLAAIGIGVCGIAFVALALRRPSGRRWTLAAAGAVAVGFLLYHAIPVELGVNNPYFTFEEGNRADAFRWFTVVVLILLGGWTARTAWRADGGPA